MIVGITGGIATGKSTVTGLLHALGAITFSADEASRAVLSKDGPVISDIRKEFGNPAIAENGTINRAALAELIFADPLARARLNNILHPRIRRLLKDQLESAKDDYPAKIVAVEIPLLYEGHLENWFERIIVVVSSEAVELERLMARNGLNADEANRRIRAQMPLADKAKLATYVVYNNGPLAALAPQVAAIWNSLKSPVSEHGLSTK